MNMNPQSPLVYLRRHPFSTFVHVAIVAAAVAALFLFITLAQETYISPAYRINQYLEGFSLVQPHGTEYLDPGIEDTIASLPDVERVLPQKNVRIKVPNVGGANFPFRLFGLRESDTAEVIARCGAALAEGRLPEPGSNGVTLSEEIARALGLRIGDTFDASRDQVLYMNIEQPLELTGILSGGARLGIMSYEFMERVSVSPFAITGLLVLPRRGAEAAAAAFLESSVRGPTVRVTTDSSRAEDVARDQELLFVLGIPVLLLTALAVTLVIAAMNRLSFARRLRELGALSCLGKSRGWLVRRLTLETAAAAFAGWLLGILFSWAVLTVVSANVYAPRGFAFPPFGLTALPLVLIVPIVVTGWALIAAAKAIGRMDPVSIVERGELALEGGAFARRAKKHTGKLPRPLSSRAYYRRHPRLAALFASVTALMILATALVIAVFSAGVDTLQPGFNNLGKVSALTPFGRPLEEETISRIRANPDVERLIPVYDFSPLKISVPPMFPDHPIQTLSVSSPDMEYLVALYGLALRDGRLPRAGTNEIVLPWQVAENRNIRVGDVIGDPIHPLYPNASALPVPFTVSGVFAPAGSPSAETWLSFTSLEFVEQYRVTDLSLIIVPKEGAKNGLDAWLKTEVPRQEAFVYTYESYRSSVQKEMKSMLFSFALIESCIAAAAVLVLAGLSYGFLSRRKKELGVLVALGFTRGCLVARVVMENAAVIGAAWLSAMLVLLGILIFLQNAVYDPVGLRLNFANPIPWLFTLPVPAASLLACLGVARRMMSGLDPLAIIEGR